MRDLRDALPKYPGIIHNLEFYSRQLVAERERKFFPEPEGFWAGSVAVSREGVAVVRTADYYIEPNGGWYKWRSSKVTTRNFRCRYDSASRSFSGWDELVNPPPFRDPEVVGLEDVRLCGDTFTATRDMATNNLGSNIQDANAIANTSRN